MTIQINDLPQLKDLTPEQLKELFGAGKIRLNMEALEDRLVQSGFSAASSFGTMASVYSRPLASAYTQLAPAAVAAPAYSEIAKSPVAAAEIYTQLDPAPLGAEAYGDSVSSEVAAGAPISRIDSELLSPGADWDTVVSPVEEKNRIDYSELVTPAADWVDEVTPVEQANPLAKLFLPDSGWGDAVATPVGKTPDYSKLVPPVKEFQPVTSEPALEGPAQNDDGLQTRTYDPKLGYDPVQIQEGKNAVKARVEQLRGTLGKPLADNQSPRIAGDNRGVLQDFENGTVIWSPETGAKFMSRAIRDKWGEVGGSLYIGYPMEDEGLLPGSKSNGAVFCDFYSRARGSKNLTTIVSFKQEGTTYTSWIFAEIRNSWARLELGVPLGDAVNVTGGRAQYFFGREDSGAIIAWTPETGANPIYGQVAGAWLYGVEQGTLAGCFPIDKGYQNQLHAHFKNVFTGVQFALVSDTVNDTVHFVGGAIYDTWMAYPSFGDPRTDEADTDDGAFRFMNFSITINVGTKYERTDKTAIYYEKATGKVFADYGDGLLHYFQTWVHFKPGKTGTTSSPLVTAPTFDPFTAYQQSTSKTQTGALYANRIDPTTAYQSTYESTGKAQNISAYGKPTGLGATYAAAPEATGNIWASLIGGIGSGNTIDLGQYAVLPEEGPGWVGEKTAVEQGNPLAKLLAPAAGEYSEITPGEQKNPVIYSELVTPAPGGYTNITPVAQKGNPIDYTQLLSPGQDALDYVSDQAQVPAGSLHIRSNPSTPPSDQEQGRLAIEAKVAKLGATRLGAPIDQVSKPTKDGYGRIQNFQNGTIIWSPATGAHLVEGLIRKEYNRQGGLSLGYPVTDAIPQPSWQGVFAVQDFRPRGWEPGQDASAIFWTTNAVRTVSGDILAKWGQVGGIPISDEIFDAATNSRSQSFLLGGLNSKTISTIVSSASGTHDVTGAFHDKWMAMGGLRFGVPTTNSLVPDKDGVLYKTVYFSGGSAGLAAISNGPQGPQAIFGKIYLAWREHGGVQFGRPLTDEKRQESSGGGQELTDGLSTTLPLGMNAYQLFVRDDGVYSTIIYNFDDDTIIVRSSNGGYLKYDADKLPANSPPIGTTSSGLSVAEEYSPVTYDSSTAYQQSTSDTQTGAIYSKLIDPTSAYQSTYENTDNVQNVSAYGRPHELGASYDSAPEATGNIWGSLISGSSTRPTAGVPAKDVPSSPDKLIPPESNSGWVGEATGVDHANPVAELYTPAAGSPADLGQQAYELDQSLDLHLDPTGEWLNWGGRNEKWVMGKDGWYFISPEGELSKWDGSSTATGTLVASLDASFYQDLNKLVDAEDPVERTEVGQARSLSQVLAPAASYSSVVGDNWINLFQNTVLPPEVVSIKPAAEMKTDLSQYAKLGGSKIDLNAKATTPVENANLGGDFAKLVSPDAVPFLDGHSNPIPVALPIGSQEQGMAAIAAKASNLGASLGQPLPGFEDWQPNGGIHQTQDGTGLYRAFQNGSIYWSPASAKFDGNRGVKASIAGAHVVSPAIRDGYLKAGPELVGYPITDTQVLSGWTGAATNDYDLNTNQVVRGPGAQFSDFISNTGIVSIIWTPQTGSQVVSGAFRQKWFNLGAGSYGVPAGPPYQVAGGIAQDFLLGNADSGLVSTIVSSAKTGTHDVAGAIRDSWIARGASGGFGNPVSDSTVFAASGNRLNEVVHFSKDGHGAALTISPNGVYSVYGYIYNAWLGLGGPQFGTANREEFTDEGPFAGGNGRNTTFTSPEGLSRSIRWNGGSGDQMRFYVNWGDGKGSQLVNVVPRNGPTGFELVEGRTGTTSSGLTEEGYDLSTAYQQSASNTQTGALYSKLIDPTSAFQSTISKDLRPTKATRLAIEDLLGEQEYSGKAAAFNGFDGQLATAFSADLNSIGKTADYLNSQETIEWVGGDFAQSERADYGNLFLKEMEAIEGYAFPFVPPEPFYPLQWGSSKGVSDADLAAIPPRQFDPDSVPPPESTSSSLEVPAVVESAGPAYGTWDESSQWGGSPLLWDSVEAGGAETPSETVTEETPTQQDIVDQDVVEEAQAQQDEVDQTLAEEGQAPQDEVNQVEASALQADAVQALAAQLVSEHGLGSYHPEWTEDNWLGRGERWILNQSNEWYFITPDGGLFRYNDSEADSALVGTLDGSYWENLDKLLNPATTEVGETVAPQEEAIASQEDVAVRAAQLVGEHGLGSYHPEWTQDNWLGRGERWILSNANEWYFITPDGGLFRYNGSEADSALVGTLDPSYWENLDKLLNASA